MKSKVLLIGAFLFFASFFVAAPLGLLMVVVSFFNPTLRATALYTLAATAAGELIGGVLMYLTAGKLDDEPEYYQEKGDESGMKKYGVTDEDLMEELIAELMKQGKTLEEAKAEAEKILAKAKEEQPVG
jgi:hypothetical protein